MGGSTRTAQDEAAAVLAASPFFADLTAEQLHALTPLFRVAEYPESSEIYRLGDMAESFYVLVDGLVRFTIGHGNRHASGGEVIRSGEIFG